MLCRCLLLKMDPHGAGQTYMDKCTNSSNRTKNIGLNKETNESVLFPWFDLFT